MYYLSIIPLYTGGLFYCYKFGRVHLSFKKFLVYFAAFILFLMEILLANRVYPDQTAQLMASDLVFTVCL